MKKTIIIFSFLLLTLQLAGAVNSEPKELILSSISSKVVSQNKVVLSWSTNLVSQSEIDVYLLDDSGAVEEEYTNIFYEYPPVNYYKQYRFLLESGEQQVELLPNRNYRFKIRAYTKDGLKDERQGSIFKTKPKINLSLFVQNGTGEILTYSFPNDTRNAKPFAKIKNPKDHQLIRTAYDNERDILYSTTKNLNGILVFTGLTKSGNYSQTRVIQGGRTGINRPSAIYLDELNDTLYVANKGNNSIIVFNRASLAFGNVKPNRVVKGATTWINRPTGMTLDEERDVLYISCAPSAGDTVLTFFPASEVTGNVQPKAKLFGSITEVKKPVDIAYDQVNEFLYVLLAEGRVIVFNEMKGSEYIPTSKNRLHQMKPPARQLKGSSWNMSFSPSKDFGAMCLDVENDKLYLSGKPDTESSEKNILLSFENVSTLAGDAVKPTGRIDAPQKIVAANGVVYSKSSGSIFSILYDDTRSYIASYNLKQMRNNEAVSPTFMKTQVSAFRSDLMGLTFDSTTNSLITLAGNILSFGVNTIKNSWNYFNADNVYINSDENSTLSDFENIEKTKFVNETNTLYVLNTINYGSIEAFDNFNGMNKVVIPLKQNRFIIPDIRNHTTVDYAIDSVKDILYVLAMPESNSDKRAKVLIFNGVSTLDGIAVPVRTLNVTALPDNNVSKTMRIEVDPYGDRIFISSFRKIEVYDNISVLSGEVEFSKIITGNDSQLGLIDTLLYYQNDDYDEKYLIVSNKRFGGNGVTGILGFSQRALNGDTENEDYVIPMFNLSGGQTGLFDPRSITIGRLVTGE